MLICLSELAECDDDALRLLVVVVVNVELARDVLFHAERLVDWIGFIGLPDVAPPLDGTAPELQRLGAHGVDLASDIKDSETEGSFTFSPYSKAVLSGLLSSL